MQITYISVHLGDPTEMAHGFLFADIAHESSCSVPTRIICPKGSTALRIDW